MAGGVGSIAVRIITDPGEPPDIIICSGAILNQLVHRASGVMPIVPYKPDTLYSLTKGGVHPFYPVPVAT